MRLRFGTDGVRGVANRDLSAEYVLALGRAAARVLGADRWVVGRDTRLSGSLLQSALAAGLAAEGATVDLMGIVPTPAVAHAARSTGAAGAMVSASHNPFPDNGVKVFAPGGRKLSDAVQAELERMLDDVLDGQAPPEDRIGSAVGTAGIRSELVDQYVASVIGTVGEQALRGLRVVVDVANGAAYRIAPEVLRRLGAEVLVLHDRPDGTNINDGCGSLHPEALQAEVRAQRADAGLALDGDADRVVAVDATGALVDGDQIIAVCALDLRARGRLRDDTVVVTVMSNLGFRLAMAEQGITVHETPVGDRYVLDALEANDWSLGGEQSGHVIFHDLAPTGDGVLTGVQLLDVMARSQKPLAELAGVVERLPQVLLNVAVEPGSVDVLAALGPALDAARAELGERGRVFVRPSGTEPLIRIMVEAATHSLAAAVAERLAAAVRDGAAARLT